MAIEDRLQTGRISTIIRNLILDTKNQAPDNYAKLHQRLLDDFGFNLSDVSFDQERDLYVTAHYKETVNESKLDFDFNSSGSGFMQILQILTPIYRYCPEISRVVLLDEPDAHLHPNLQRALAESLRSIQQELGIQVILATHSTSIIRSSSPSEIIPISQRKRDLRPIMGEDRLESEIYEKIDSYQLGKTLISGKIEFLEDKNTEIIEAMDKVAKVYCFSGPRTIPMLTGRSKDDKLPFIVRPVLKTIVGKDVDVLFIRDGDGLNEKWRKKLFSYAKAKGVKLIVLSVHEIENYLLSPELVLRSLNRRYPESKQSKPTIDQIRTKITESLRATITQSQYNFDHNLEDTILKTALLLGDDEYRGVVKVREEAVSIRESYETLIHFEDLIKVGMGKEALRLVLSWLNEEIKLNLPRRDLISSIERTDVPSEALAVLRSLKSRA